MKKRWETAVIFFFTFVFPLCIGLGAASAGHHSADYAPKDYSIGLSELLRVVQIYNEGA